MIKKLILLFLFSFSSSALELDAKFIARILGVSDSKKTVLLNKGQESGLKVGEHAKISLPTGMIARAVCVKISPSRSVWSVYRFFAKKKIIAQIAVTVKIASPVELTSDETRHLGVWAEKYGKKSERIPEEEMSKEEVQKKTDLKLSFIKSDKVISQYDDVDYTNLDDRGEPKELDPDIDWTGLDGKKDLDSFDSKLDYGSLK